LQPIDEFEIESINDSESTNRDSLKENQNNFGEVGNKQ